MLGSGRFAGGGPCGRRHRSSPAAGGPSQGIVLACRRPRMASACWLASSWDRRSNAKLMDCRSWRRNSGLMCCPNRAGSPAVGRTAPALFRRRARAGRARRPGIRAARRRCPGPGAASACARAARRRSGSSPPPAGSPTRCRSRTRSGIRGRWPARPRRPAAAAPPNALRISSVRSSIGPPFRFCRRRGKRRRVAGVGGAPLIAGLGAGQVMGCSLLCATGRRWWVSDGHSRPEPPDSGPRFCGGRRVAVRFAASLSLVIELSHVSLVVAVGAAHCEQGAGRGRGAWRAGHVARSGRRPVR